jgi:hypothetical protein
MIQEEYDHAYRLRPYFRNIGIACTSLFLCAWIGSVLVAYFNIDGSFARPGLAIIFFSIVWGSFTLLGVWLILAYFKYRLLRYDNTICHVGILQNKIISLDTLQELKWRQFPQGGSCVLTAVGTYIKIEFNNFTKAEQTELIAYLRGRVNEDLQTNWDAFYHRFLVVSPERARQQHSLKRILILAIFGLAAAFAALWLLDRGAHFLVLSIVNMVVGTRAVLRDRHTKKQHNERPAWKLTAFVRGLCCIAELERHWDKSLGA